MAGRDMESIQEERKFIHDVSSPLMVALGMIDVGTDILEKKQDIETAQVKLEKAKKALDKLTLILKERRTLLIKYTEDIEGPEA